MRSINSLVLLSLFLVTIVSAAWAGPQDFQLFNRTGVDIYALYVAPSDSEDWGDDLMEGTVLKNGGDLAIEFAPGDEVELWDIWVEDVDGNALYWREINLMTAVEIVLEPNEVARIKE